MSLARLSAKQLERKLAQRLYQLPEARGYTLPEVQAVTGVQVGRFETGQAKLTVVTLVVLCQQYGVSEAEFFIGITGRP
ncbi:MAG: helix-turn-helix domain-containing protein [Janthinobacterium lividum]